MIDKAQDCFLCGAEVFELFPLEGSRRAFCSRECASEYEKSRLPLPCPFCGVDVAAHHYEIDGWSIECRNRECPVQPETKGFYPVRIAAVQSWNIRFEVSA